MLNQPTDSCLFSLMIGSCLDSFVRIYCSLIPTYHSDVGRPAAYGSDTLKQLSGFYPVNMQYIVLLVGAMISYLCLTPLLARFSYSLLVKHLMILGCQWTRVK